ncbi:hypothetical protein HJFPF1_02302 [Paramyrothecium foliicola]|nr:hypothetical protein HJFPF1_02302 [Paramyrothecium foliicola]
MSEENLLKFEHIRLATKPTAQICYSFSPSPLQGVDPVLVVFVNGLGLPQIGWTLTIAHLRNLAGDKAPAILTYDRFGQGQTTDHDPNDADAKDPSHAHDCISAVHDMQQLISQILNDKMNIQGISKVKFVFVGNSIGCSIIRLHAQKYPGIMTGAVFLDSTLTDSDFVSIFPDPDAEGFDEGSLPHGVTPRDLRIAREKVGAIFHPDVGNKEGLSRRNLKELLPQADSPTLGGAGGRGPYVTVVGHDFETFAEQTHEGLGISIEVIRNYMNPYWSRYNEGLSKLTDSERSRGPLQAPGAGHFIQADNPKFVAQIAHEMLQLL